jgi:hypothetical protein
LRPLVVLSLLSSPEPFLSITNPHHHTGTSR